MTEELNKLMRLSEKDKLAIDEELKELKKFKESRQIGLDPLRMGLCPRVIFGPRTSHSPDIIIKIIR